jgi:hypothetical protein
MLSCTFRRSSFSMVMLDSSAVIAVMVLLGMVPIFALGKMENLARMRDEC